METTQENITAVPCEYCGQADEHVTGCPVLGELLQIVEQFDETTLVDGKEARIITERPLPLPTTPDVKRAIERLEKARQKFAEACEDARDAAAEKKARQERLNEAVDAVVAAQRAVDEPSLF